MLRRFLFYLTGFAAGLLITLILFEDFDNPIFAWTPSQRVKKKIIYGTKNFKCDLKDLRQSCRYLRKFIIIPECTCEQIIKSIARNFHINFSESLILDTIKTYHFYKDTIVVKLTIIKDTAILTSIPSG